MIKIIKAIVAVCMVFSLVPLLCGCCCGGLDIKDTSGIKDYLSTQARCELLAIRIKKYYSAAPQYQKAEASYNTAAAYGNAYMADLIVSIKTSHVVDVSDDSFKNSDAFAKMQGFLAYEALTAPKQGVNKLEVSPSEVTAAEEAVKGAIGIFTSMQDRIQAETDANLKVLEEEWFSRVYWNSFDKTTEDSFNMKWTRTSQAVGKTK
jgi:hypothetical protein